MTVTEFRREKNIYITSALHTQTETLYTYIACTTVFGCWLVYSTRTFSLM